LVRHGSAFFPQGKSKNNNHQDTVLILDKYLVVPPKPTTVPDIWEFSHQEIQINPAIFMIPAVGDQPDGQKNGLSDKVTPNFMVNHPY
jgi:hypothetical protein